MKHLHLLLAAFLVLLLPLQAAEVSIAVDPNATNEAIPMRQKLNSAQANFDELYNGAATTPETITYATTETINFATAAMKITALTGNVTLATSNLVAGKTVVLIVTGGASSRNYTALPAWVFVGSAAPTALAANKTGLFVLRSTGTTDAGVVASYLVQP